MPSPPKREGAVLVAVQFPDVSDAQHAADLAELARLVQTLGYEVVGTVSQKRQALAAAAVLGEGKLLELSEYTAGDGVVPSGAPERKSKGRERWVSEAKAARGERGGDGDAGSPAKEREEARAALVVVDHEVSPSQARNLERATGAKVTDRTGVIVEIFHRHAQSREARLQVEIARLNYVAPRLREAGGKSDRQKGKGAGESMLELDRRRIRDRVAELRKELAAIDEEQKNRRSARREKLRVALVGYTNAGKSSLMRALTGSEVLVADKLFATLDTTVRAIQPETKPRLLVSDTVGFIKKLPHDLVASFRSTLDEALEASLLLYVVDAADPTHEAQLEVTHQVLGEIGADRVPSRLVMNKCDKLSGDELTLLRARHPAAIFVSAHDGSDVVRLRDEIVRFFDEQLVEGRLTVPYDKQALTVEIHEGARVVEELYDESGGHLAVMALPAAIARWTRMLEPSRERGSEDLLE